MRSRLPAMWLGATLVGAFAVSGCASRSLPTGVPSVVDMAPQPALDLAAPQPLDMAPQPLDMLLSNVDLLVEKECGSILECVIDSCISSDTGCIEGCEAGHSAAALMDAQTLLACAIPNCGSTFMGFGASIFNAIPCMANMCNAQFQTCSIPLPPGP